MISTAMKSLKQKSKAAASAAVHPTANVALQDSLPLPSVEDKTNNLPIQEAPASRPTTTTTKPGAPRLTNSINPEYLNCSKLSTAHELQKKQKNGKDTVNQSFTCDKLCLYVMLPIRRVTRQARTGR
jgi:hypothetical protein